MISVYHNAMYDDVRIKISAKRLCHVEFEFTEVMYVLWQCDDNTVHQFESCWRTIIPSLLVLML